MPLLRPDEEGLLGEIARIRRVMVTGLMPMVLAAPPVQAQGQAAPPEAVPPEVVSAIEALRGGDYDQALSAGRSELTAAPDIILGAVVMKGFNEIFALVCMGYAFFAWYQREK